MKKVFPYIMLHAIIILYSLASICSKVASSKEFMSLEWILFYGLEIFILGVYAILWQQILKKIPVNIACTNKAVTLIWSTIWGIVLFSETITWNNFIGAVVVLVGVILMVAGAEEKQHE